MTAWYLLLLLVPIVIAVVKAFADTPSGKPRKWD